MLAQTDQFAELAPVIAWGIAAAAAFVGGGQGLAKIVDAIRYFDKDDDPRFKILWVGAALVIGIGACLAFEINIADGLLKQLPAFANSDALSGTAGQVVTGIGLAGAAGYWHERMDLASSEAKTSGGISVAGDVETATVTNVTPPQGVDPAPPSNDF